MDVCVCCLKLCGCFSFVFKDLKVVFLIDFGLFKDFDDFEMLVVGFERFCGLL